MRKSENYYIYPAYFEAGRSRRSGRRIPKNLALQHIDTSLIGKAAQRLGLTYSVNAKGRYSASWWGMPGVVLIKKPADQSKTELLKELAKVMKSLRAAGAK